MRPAKPQRKPSKELRWHQPNQAGFKRYLSGLAGHNVQKGPHEDATDFPREELAVEALHACQHLSICSEKKCLASIPACADGQAFPLQQPCIVADDSAFIKCSDTTLPGTASYHEGGWWSIQV